MSPQAATAQPTKILFAPKQDAAVTEMARISPGCNLGA